jgi:uncharacterized protein (TIGR02246 family)
MSSQTFPAQDSSTPSEDPAESKVRELYRRMLAAWNNRNAVGMAALFDDEGYVVGFDGSQVNGRAEIESEMGRIFAHHPTPPYFGKTRGVRFVTPEVAILRAVAGMVPPGKSDIDPTLNAVQSLVASRSLDGEWRIALFQTTPAQFHGRPELVQQLTDELRQLI